MTWELEAVREDRPETDSNDSKAALPSLWSFDVQPEELFAPQVCHVAEWLHAQCATLFYALIELPLQMQTVNRRDEYAKQ